VRLNWKNLRWITTAALLLLGAGCSGVNVSKSVSPLDFILPGLIKADPPPTQPEKPTPAAQPVVQVAKI